MLFCKRKKISRAFTAKYSNYYFNFRNDSKKKLYIRVILLSRSITRRVESPRMAANSPRHLIVRCCKLHLHIYIHDTFGRYRWHTRGCARRNGASRENGPELVRYVIPVEVEVFAGAAAWRQAGPPFSLSVTIHERSSISRSWGDGEATGSKGR